MIAEQQHKAKVAGSISLAFFLLMIVAVPLSGSDPSSVWRTVLPLLSLSCGIALVTALWFHLGAKARSKAWLLLLIFSVVGLAAILLLPDKSDSPRI